MKREFNIGETARMSKGMKARGFMLRNQDEVKIAGYKKIPVKNGAYLYDIEVTNPKTSETVLLEGWVTQFDLIGKEMWDRLQEQERQIAEIKAQMGQ